MSRSCPSRTSSTTRTCSGTSTSGRTSTAPAISARWWPTSRDRLDEEVEWPAEFRAEMLGEYTERQAASNRSEHVRDRGGDRHLPAAAGVVRQLATRDAVVPDLADRAGRRRDRGVPHAAASSRSARSSGFFTVLGIVARNGIMLISHYQHLEQFEGVPFGPGAGAAGRPRAAGADHDDGADDRAGARSR